MDKSTGIDYNREAFLPASEPPSVIAGLKGLLLLLCGVAVVVVVAFLGYREFGRVGETTSSDTQREFVQLKLQLTQMDDRLDRLEQENHHFAAQSIANSKKPAAVAENDATPNPNAPGRVVYRVTPSLSQQPRVVVVTPSDAVNTQKLAALQKDLGAAQDDASANREAWQATTDRLADVAGQIGSQHGEILRSQDELNQLLGQTQRSALSFELRRGSSPEQLGPVTVALRSTNAKTQRYTLCVYVQHSCVELKDRTLYEVVQVALSRNAPPLQVIATKVGRDGIAGYVEVPREAAGR
jgi:hypothetical protein